jgi:hypothetical protein
MVDPYARLPFHEFLLALIRAINAIALHALPVMRAWHHTNSDKAQTACQAAAGPKPLTASIILTNTAWASP